MISIRASLKRGISSVLSAVMIASSVMGGVVGLAQRAGAADATVQKIEEQIAEYEKTQQELKNKLNSNKNEASKAAENKAYLDTLIYTIEAKIVASEALIEQLGTSVSEAEAEIAQCQRDMGACEDKLTERMRMMQDGGNVSYLEMVLEAEDLSDFLSRIEHINAMMEYDKKLSDEYASLKAELQTKKAELEASLALQKETVASLEADRAEARQLAVNAQSYIDQLASDAQQYQNELDKATAAENELDKKLTEYLKSLEEQNSSPVVAQGEYAWPLPAGQGWITCKFGGSDPNNRPHYALDIAIGAGTSIYATNEGTVLFAGWHNSYGYYILIDHGNGMASLYAHCSALLVSTGQTVSQGQTIGKVGNTGFSKGNHLHFEIRKNGQRVNPLNYMAPQAPENIL